MKTCHACGMPLIKPEDFAKGDVNSNFCRYCIDKEGNVKSCEQIFEGGVKFFMQHLGSDRVLAEKVVRKNMSQLPYWKDKNCELLKGEMVSDEEYEKLKKQVGE